MLNSSNQSGQTKTTIKKLSAKTVQIYCFSRNNRNISEMANKIKTKQNRMKRRMSAEKKLPARTK